MAQLRQLALDLINKDRADNGLTPVALGGNPMAQAHAEQMLINNYAGYWWIDGRKPYMVYSETGGKSYVSVNVGASGFTDQQWASEGCGRSPEGCVVPSPEAAIAESHEEMMSGGDGPNRSRRERILNPSHRSVSIGAAWNGRRVVFTQHFEGGAAVALNRTPLLLDRTLILELQKEAPDAHIHGAVDVYYDPPPASMSSAAINALDSYCVGGGPTAECVPPLVRILPPPASVGDGDDRVRALDWRETDNTFTFAANMGLHMQKPGVYTVVVWRNTDGGSMSEKLVELSVFVG